ncbi:hypothetical protein [Aquipseudomonas alcaligenes]|uniref:hypothetical protein n=1 Tax=Aquipseudomonas alcaligenes TaxID=43263 RepID=UPI001658C632|nr:hypothetical protein [Pseudomonas alcaligenes]
MEFAPDTPRIALSVLFVMAQFTLFILYVIEAIQAAKYSKNNHGFIFNTWFLSPKDYPGGEKHCKRGFLYALLSAAGFGALYWCGSCVNC